MSKVKTAEKAKTEWPTPEISRRPVSGLIPYAKNARTHSAAQIDEIAESIRRFGGTYPPLIDEKDMIIAGHGRVLAAEKLEIAELPVLIARDWSDAQKRAYILADNQLALNAGWDLKTLGAELTDLKGMGADITGLGFSPDQLRELTNDFRPAGQDTQGQLDEMTRRIVKCPHCEQSFDLKTKN